MEASARPAPNAATSVAKNATGASPSIAGQTGQNGFATTVAGQAAKLSAAVQRWAEDTRNLSAETLAQLPVASGTTFFPDAGKKLEGLFFRYADGWKARSVPEKHFVSGGGFKLSFWNLDAVLKSKLDSVFIVEGELDACALVEAGIPHNRVLSVPNGAKQKAADEPAEMRGYDYVKEALKAGLSRAKRFVWCGDADDQGLALRADMVRLLGAARFSFVDWPEGCKDANDFLISDGPDALCELVSEGAIPWPVDGLYRLSELPEPAPLTIWRPGFEEWESKLLLAPRTLSVVTGHPGHGKTQLWQQIWFQVSRQYSVPIAIASFETRAKPHIRRQLRTLLSGKLEKDMSAEEVAKADAWIDDRYLFMVHNEERPTLDWLLDRAEIAIVRHGARVIQLDPWNRLDEGREARESETDYIRRCLRAVHSFAHDMNCHVQIIAHPAKMGGERRGNAPELEDISGSKHWDNMVDQGFVVHRPEVYDNGQVKTETLLLHKKARFSELGHTCQLKLNFDLKSWRYKSTDFETGGY